MNINNIKKLKTGDEIYWSDPDDGACSRIYKIKTIEVRGRVISIEEPNGSVLECLANELTSAVEKTYRVKVYWEMSGEVTVKGYSKQHASKEAVDAPLPPSDTWEYVPDSANVDEELDITEIKE